jgi:homoserine O-acetyltransferase
VVLIACGATHTAWQIGISEVQRQAIYADPNWESDPFQATKGLEVARQVGMVSYRTPEGFRRKFGRQVLSAESQSPLECRYGSNTTWSVKSYLEYQGVKIIDRFDPVTYVKLTEQLDSHDVARGRVDGSVSEVLKRIEIPACILGIDSDILYPLPEQKELAEMIPNSDLHIIHSDDGHDGFLLEQEQVSRVIVDFLDHCMNKEQSLSIKLRHDRYTEVMAQLTKSRSKPRTVFCSSAEQRGRWSHTRSRPRPTSGVI